MSVQRQIDKLMVYRAAEWLEVLRMGRSEEYPEFMRWISESPRHMDELLNLLALSHEASHVLRNSTFDKSALLARISPQVTDFHPSAHESAERVAAARRRIRWAGGLAASVAALVPAALWINGSLSPWKHLETRIGQQSTFNLDDGSVVTLNARSKIAVKFGQSSRDIRLLDGEALFKAAQDARRPFRVHTREALVQAVGTEFDVAAGLSGTKVSVVEGKVQILTKTQAGMDRPDNDEIATHAPLPLEAGQAAHVSSKGTIQRKSAEEAANATAWRQRRLIFEQTPLEEAVNEFNRYHESMQLRVEGLSAGSHHYSGTFDVDDLKSFTDLLSRERDLVVERRENEMIIRPR